MPDYENDLAFEPALSWKDLCDWVYGIRDKLAEQYIIIFENENKYIQVGIIRFFENKEVRAENNALISRDMSYERMKTIIEALWGE